MNSLLERAEEKVKAFLQEDSSGHDWWHIHRVVQLALRLAENYPQVNRGIIHLAALMHDVGDYKLHNGDEERGKAFLHQMLDELNCPIDLRTPVLQIINEMSFRGGVNKTPPSTLEGEIVQDADRLDAIGAIGIGRAFAFGGVNHRLMYDPNIEVQEFKTAQAYKEAKGTTINHFYEKLLKLSKGMNTQVAQQIANERHTYMQQFVDRFLQEWNGNDSELA
jgi:uncharacterized protein